MYSLSDERTSEVLDTVAHIARDQFAGAVAALEEVA
jgi:hypothetical protein